MALVDGILQIKEQDIRCYRWDITGLLSSRMYEIMSEGATIASAWGSLVDPMKCLYRHRLSSNLLRNGLSTLLDPSTHPLKKGPNFSLHRLRD